MFETSIRPQAVSPLKGDCYIRAMSLAPTFRRPFRRKFWPHEKTEPLLLPFKAWAFTWYRYCPASTVPLREECTESLCDMSLARTFRRHFRRKFGPHEKTEPLLLPFERWALTWYRYWPASNVPLREKCTEKWCPWGYCTHFQTLFPTEILAARKNWTLIITV